MRVWRVLIASSVMALVGLTCSRPANWHEGTGALALMPAADYLVDAFDKFPLVAFSEPRHAAGGTKQILTSLLRHPGFAGRVNDIVVEFGNARFQDIADRYVSGAPVAPDELKQIWENTTVVTGVWTAPVYEWMLGEVRALNGSLQPGKHVRVVLGDPPIDWSLVRGPADEDMNDWRDAHFAWVVSEQVLKRQRRALIWIGGAHISRRVRFPDSLIHLLDRRFPNRTFVALSIDRRDVDDRVSAQLRQWPSMMAAPVRGTWLGRLDAPSVGWRLSTRTVEENVDAAIFWEFPVVHPDDAPRVDLSSPAGVELQRRQQLARATTPFRGGEIRFREGSATLAPDSDKALATVLAELQRDAGLNLIVKAFADARELDGLQLSSLRAATVVDWLVDRGISRDRLEPRGCGSSRALWVGDTEAERAANRKAELVRSSAHIGCEPPLSFEFARAHRGASSAVLLGQRNASRSDFRRTVREER